jgi:hypothetical protein
VKPKGISALVTCRNRYLTQPSYLVSPCIEVHVGKEESFKKYIVHTGLVTEWSEFFARALNGQWKESDENITTLPEDDQEVFELYLQLIYTNTVPVDEDINIYTDAEKQIKKDKETLAQDIQAATSRELVGLNRLYVFCEKLQDSVSKDLVVTATVAQTKELRPDNLSYWPGSLQISRIYEGTVLGNSARKLLVDMYAWNSTVGWFKDHGYDDYAAEFLYDLNVCMLQVNKNIEMDPSRDATNYHEGTKGKSKD